MKRFLTFLLIGIAVPAAADTVVAAKNLRPGMIVSAQDIKLVEAEIAGGFQLLEDVIGQEVRVVLYAGRPVLPNDIGPPALIDRNQIVTLIYTAGPMTILAEGRSLGRGAVGDRVRVMNLSSRTTITGSVSPNGDVIVSNSHTQF
ncbi:flagellar basal body P-ring formation chaperone FlgA [uncultured Aliiroseovarius sp.]|uniref:flagellar basal body P-ring formation chaperone FlgA n=1 Tax=uncultured Aliiroseovarius sp. TaxID=1658783 RepID=UPI0026351BC1|nr:flagellar basal body P-ring formation chaperone FlgA [uncultured Aliiroseovarius sp.]